MRAFNLLSSEVYSLLRSLAPWKSVNGMPMISIRFVLCPSCSTAILVHIRSKHEINHFPKTPQSTFVTSLLRPPKYFRDLGLVIFLFHCSLFLLCPRKTPLQRISCTSQNSGFMALVHASTKWAQTSAFASPSCNLPCWIRAWNIAWLTLFSQCSSRQGTACSTKQYQSKTSAPTFLSTIRRAAAAFA